MIREKSKNTPASVRARLLALAQSKGEDYQRVLGRFAIERFLSRLGRSPHRDKFVLKGAILFTLWTGQTHRPTKDLDLLGRGSSAIGDLEEIIGAICEVQEEDGIVFDSKSVEGTKIKEEDEYDGVRIKFQAELGGARIPMQIDIGFGDRDGFERLHPALSRGCQPAERELGSSPAHFHRYPWGDQPQGGRKHPSNDGGAAMKTVAMILELAAPLHAGFHIRIENEPWMTLVIEDTQERGPNGLPAISVAHYGEQNGDLMRDPEMIFEAEESGKGMNLVPYYWRNDYAGIEQYSAFVEKGRTLQNAKLKREHTAFAHVWDANLKAQGFLEAFVRQQKGDT